MHSYETLRTALSGAGVSSDSSELHGGMCASLCVGGLSASGAWTADWLDVDDEPESAAVNEVIRKIEADSWHAMSAGTFALELLLPDEDVELAQQIAGLAAWCDGFVSGLGVAGLSLAEHSPSVRTQLEEIIRDFGEIARASTEVEDVVEGGFQLASIVEFVRAGVQIVFESLAQQREVRIAGRLH